MEGSGGSQKCDLRACARMFVRSEQPGRGKEAWAAMVWRLAAEQGGCTRGSGVEKTKKPKFSKVFRMMGNG